ncbi:MAG: ribosomal protein S18-alanine N-acetyltransferase [Burkholderiales bacterium]|nr:ribosomal protein S18-alanine N-acetyltransferase [Burkholderiales bacterium]
MSAVLRPDAPRLAPMTEGDLDAVLAIETAIYPFPWTRGNFLDSLAAGYSCWLFVSDAALLGYAVIMFAVDEAHLLNLSIAREAQRRGHGAQLLAAVEDSAHGHGAQSMLLEVRPSNMAGRALYAKAGYQQVGLRRGYYPAALGREDALVLARKL